MKTDKIQGLNFKALYVSRNNYSNEQQKIIESLKNEFLSEQDKQGRSIIDAFKQDRNQDILIRSAGHNKIAVEIMNVDRNNQRLGVYSSDNYTNAIKDLKFIGKSNSYLSKALAIFAMIVSSAIIGSVVSKCQESKPQTTHYNIFQKSAIGDTVKAAKILKI